jgi:class 3 adenylate cyclase/tetratricopeptide (TPR) repeat protein
MAQPYPQKHANPRERLGRYLPQELVDAIAGAEDTTQAPIHRVREAFAHLAATRYTVTTYLPRLLVQQLLDEQLVSPWLRRLDGSLLFADLSGSTALADQLSALGREGTELVTGFLNRIFGTMIQVILDHGGDLISFGGDAMLVFFNDRRHAHTAARAALALQQATHDYVETVPNIGAFPMHLHIGVESGAIDFFSAGLPHDLQYSVLGATVNSVVYAEGLAGPGEIVVGPGAALALTGAATGVEVAPGYIRLDDLTTTEPPPAPAPEPRPTPLEPETAIPHLLDDLDRIGPYILHLLMNRILADPQAPRVEADLRPVTILFAQALGLEAITALYPEATAAQFVQIYVSVMQEAIELFGGVINKLDIADEGVKIIAIFGAPVAYEDHPIRAARAALEMQERLGRVNQQIDVIRQADEGRRTKEESNKEQNNSDSAIHSSFVVRRSSFVEMKQRIGLNLGAAFAGNVGNSDRKEYTVMGDTVNVAARVMAQTEWDEIWCSEAAIHAVADRMDYEARGVLPLKGKAAPLPLFRLVGERNISSTIAMRNDSLMVGRESELRTLAEHLDAVVGGGGRVVRIVGEAGVGKSRLTTELIELATERNVRIIPAVCLSHTTRIPYAAWSEWLRALCGIAPNDNDDERASKLAEQLAELGPGVDKWLPLLGDLVRIDIPENRLTRGLDPQMRQARRFELLGQLLLHTAAAGPVLALFEDLHRADAMSLDLWSHVASMLEQRPVLLLGIHRPDKSLAALDDGAHILELHALSAEESQQMAVELLSTSDLPAPLLQQIVQRAGGNPLFLVELLRAVLARQHTLDNLPDSLSGLILARIDQLDEPSRGLLRVASVIGQRIPFGVLHALQTIDQAMLLRNLGRLDTQQMTVLERLEPERVDVFRHALIQEVAYQSMLYARRRELHGRIGAYLEARYADKLDDYYGLLAHHYRLSDQRDKAIEYLLKAGHAARNIYANDEAIQYYDWTLEALANSDDDPRAWEARDAVADVYTTVGRYDEALAQHAAILAAPRVAPDIARRAHCKRGSILEKQGQYVAALEELDTAMAIATSGAPDISPFAIPFIWAEIALVRKRRGEYDPAIAACEEGLAALQDDPQSWEDELIEARLHSELGGIYGMRGDYPRARRHFEHSLRLRDTIDDLPGIIVSRNNLGYLWQLQSEYELALEQYRQAEELARKINMRYALVFAAINTAWALTSLGRYLEAKAQCVEALALSHTADDQPNIARAHNTLGVVLYRIGEYDQALSAFEQAAQLNRQLGSKYHETTATMYTALTMNALGRFQEAIEAATQARHQAETLQASVLRIEVCNVLAESAIGSNQPAVAEQYALEAVALGQEIESKDDLGVALRLLGLALAIQNRPFSSYFEKSITLFEESRDQFELGRTWATYGEALLRNNDKSAALENLKQAQDTFIAIGANGELQRLAPLLKRSS